MICSICLDHIDNTPITLDCNHSFHSKCIHHWFNQKFERNCPMCRGQFIGYINKRSTRNDTLNNRLTAFEEVYLKHILFIYSTEDIHTKRENFEKLLKLIDKNRFILECDEFKKNIRECLDEPDIVSNKTYWYDKFGL